MKLSDDDADVAVSGPRYGDRRRDDPRLAARGSSCSRLARRVRSHGPRRHSPTSPRPRLTSSTPSAPEMLSTLGSSAGSGSRTGSMRRPSASWTTRSSRTPWRWRLPSRPAVLPPGRRAPDSRRGRRVPRRRARMVRGGARRTRRGEGAVERERFGDAELAHECEARRVDERVRPLVMGTQPLPRLRLELGVDPLDSNHDITSKAVEPTHGMKVPESVCEERPGLADDEVGRGCRRTFQPMGERRRVGVPAVSPYRVGDPEGRVNEGHASSEIGPVEVLVDVLDRLRVREHPCELPKPVVERLLSASPRTHLRTRAPFEMPRAAASCSSQSSSSGSIMICSRRILAMVTHQL